MIDNNTFEIDYCEEVKPSIKFCDKDESLVFFLLNLLKKLQNIGTVPAIDIGKYAEHVNTKYY